MDNQLIIYNAFKGSFVLVQTTESYPSSKTLQGIFDWIHKDKPSFEEIKSKPDLHVVNFNKINDEHEYVFLIEPYINEKDWKAANDLLNNDESDNHLITSSFFSLKRIKKILLPFI